MYNVFRDSLCFYWLRVCCACELVHFIDEFLCFSKLIHLLYDKCDRHGIQSNHAIGNLIASRFGERFYFLLGFWSFFRATGRNGTALGDDYTILVLALHMTEICSCLFICAYFPLYALLHPPPPLSVFLSFSLGLSLSLPIFHVLFPSHAPLSLRLCLYSEHISLFSLQSTAERSYVNESECILLFLFPF